MKINKKELIKDGTLLKYNVMELVKQHKKTCIGKNCNVNLCLVGLLIEKAGIKLTKNQREEILN